MEPESEIIRFIQVWILIYTSLTYCYITGKVVPAGKVRLVCILPVVVLFLLLPLRLTSVHFIAITGFFVGWLGTFKLLLFSFNKGPLAAPSCSISLPLFLVAGSLPIKITPRSELGATPDGKKRVDKDLSGQIWKPAAGYAVKAVLLAAVFKLYDFKAELHPTALMFLYCFHNYFLLEIILAVAGAAVRAGLGLELEPQFNEPYFSTSLGDFWGRRWNLVVTGILRPTVYEPVISLLSRPSGRTKARLVAVFASFCVSAIMHELMIFYLSRISPSWGMTLFFLLHGVCLMVETAIKKSVNGKWRPPRIVSAGLTISFVLATAISMFFPEYVRRRIDVKAFEDYAAIGEFFVSVRDGTIFRSFNGSESIHHFFTQLLSC